VTIRDRGLAIAACLLWASAFVGVKSALQHMPPLTLAGIRFILAGILLLPLAGGLRPLSDCIRKHTTTLLLTSLFNTVLLYSIFFISLSIVRGAQAAILIGASPLITAIVAHFMMDNDHMTRRKTVSIMMGIAGIVLLTISSKPWDPVGIKEGLGLLLLLGGSISGALGNIVVAKRRAPDLNSIALTSLQMLLGGVILLSAGLLIEPLPQFTRLPRMFYATLLWLAIISAGGFSIWFRLLERVPVSELNLWKFIIPIFGAILSWTLLSNESPDIFSIIGMIMVAIGIIHSQMPAGARKQGISTNE
jgi:drug/metabolite transporter (DMT)-like permease